MIVINYGDQMKKYKISFSLKGLVAVTLVMIPNILYSLIPYNTNLLEYDEAFGVLDILENIFRVILIITLIGIVNTDNSQKIGGFESISAYLFLSAYYLMWIMMFLGMSNAFIYIGLAVFPCVFFLITSIILRNYPACFAVAVFAAFHIIITYRNYL